MILHMNSSPLNPLPVRLFHHYKIKWKIWSTRKQYYLSLQVFSLLKWVISNMAAIMVASEQPSLFVIADSTLKEYEIITLIYKRKTCRLAHSLDNLTTSLKEKHILKYKLTWNWKHQPCIHPPSAVRFYFYFLHLQIIESIFWHHKITSIHLLVSENGENWCTLYVGHSVEIISTCYIYENRRKWFCTQTLENAANSQFNFIFLKASVENSSAQCTIFI